MNAGHTDWYDIESLHPKHRPLAEGLNDLYGLKVNGSNRLQVPDQFGQGFWERFKVSSVIEVAVCDMCFHENIEMCSNEQNGSMKWGYCLGAPIEWTVEAPNRMYRLKQGEMSVFGHRPADCVGYYQAGRQYCGITVKIAPDFIESLYSEHICPKGLEPFQTHMASPAMNRIFKEMMGCNYEGGIKRMYLEGKVLELTAAYLHDVACSPAANTGLSRTDMDSLMKAKEIVDNDVLAAPGILELSKRVCLNEFKLKKGFKQLFGMPVHAYIIDCRLEKAYQLLESGSCSVTMAAVMAGFSNPGHFAEKFRQKYGNAPSRYFGRVKS
ncbi:helix-turn-helix transcriptional regulator [Paenibacillus sp. HW567]|uniref:helix-turn-helix transcriptional regulator n=1 Tax=Paenibacillus sp. HW567 TaxID=1034769 RepID=UPI0003813579|nr:AraC family transcriptional regulator [Paenibacillus sp. HW567]